METRRVHHHHCTEHNDDNDHTIQYTMMVMVFGHDSTVGTTQENRNLNRNPGDTCKRWLMKLA